MSNFLLQPAMLATGSWTLSGWVRQPDFVRLGQVAGLCQAGSGSWTLSGWVRQPDSVRLGQVAGLCQAGSGRWTLSGCVSNLYSAGHEKGDQVKLVTLLSSYSISFLTLFDSIYFPFLTSLFLSQP